MKIIWLCVVGVLCLGCTAKKVVTSIVEPTEKSVDTTICEQEAIMLDYTSNENCGYLFQLESGLKLLPAVMPETDVPFFNSNKVIIGYRAYDEVSTRSNSLCGNEDQVVEITCIRSAEVVSKSMIHEECEPVKNVFSNSWMTQVSNKLKPQKIFEYDYAVGYLYLFRVGDKSYLYDCLGNRMCVTDDGGDCNSLIETLGEAKLLQVLKN